MAVLRVASVLWMPLWRAAVRCPFNPQGARLFWLLFLVGWRERRNLYIGAKEAA